MLKNTETTYGSVAKWLHWLIFFFILGLLIAGFSLDFISDRPTKISVVVLHKAFGLTVLALVVLRIFWALSNIKPKLPTSIPAWQRFGSTSVHYVLYVLMLAMPLSGWMMATAANKAPSYFGLAVIPMPFVPVDKDLAKFANTSHWLLAWLIVGFVSLHILAALKHHFINKDNVLKRMLPGG